MSNLKPEVRADKNGTLVTRHVKPEEPIAIRVKTNSAPKLAAVKVSKFINDPSYEVAHDLFEELNKDDADLFDEFFLGSFANGDGDDLQTVLDENPELGMDDIHSAGLSNGNTAYWVGDTNLSLPDDVPVSLESRDYRDALYELESLAETGYGSTQLRNLSNEFEVYAAYHELNGPTHLNKLIENADDAYRGHFRSEEEFAEDTFESIYGLDSSEGIEEISNYVNWDDVAATTSRYEVGLSEEDDDDANDSPDENETREYFENSLGSASGLEGYINWGSYANALLSDYSVSNGYYFRD